MIVTSLSFITLLCMDFRIVMMIEHTKYKNKNKLFYSLGFKNTNTNAFRYHH